MSEKQERVEAANELLKVIGTTGRRFFNHDGVIFHLEWEPKTGKVWFVDSFSGRRVYTHGIYCQRGVGVSGAFCFPWLDTGRRFVGIRG